MSVPKSHWQKQMSPHRSWRGKYPREKGIVLRGGRVLYLRPGSPALQPRRIKSPGVIKSFMTDFLRHTSLHGLGYLIRPNFNKFERTLWAVIFLVGLIGIGYTSLETWRRYGGTVTYIETTRYPNSKVPFPSVSICDPSMVDWQRALLLNESDLPAPFEKSKPEALQLLKRLGFLAYGEFDYLDQLRLQHVNLSTLKSINISELLLKVRRPCEEMFTGFCWWKDREIDCCTLFELQKTDRGFCWTFNSDTSEESKRLSLDQNPGGRWLDKNGEMRPRMAQALGPWSGLRVEITPMAEEKLPPDRNITSTSAMVIVGNPRAFPQGTYITVPDGVLGNLAISGDSIRTQPEVRKLSPDIRECLFQDEKAQHLSANYIQDNCVFECYWKYTIKLCGCVPDFIFDSSEHHVVPCNLDGIMCLSANNDLLNYFLWPVGLAQFKGKEGISCECPNDCETHEYNAQLLSPTSTGNYSKITLDVFFQTAHCVLYQTGITNDWLTTLVSFGGIAGLFLGASLLSIAELLYFCTIRIYCIWLGNKKNKQKVVNNRRNDKFVF